MVIETMGVINGTEWFMAKSGDHIAFGYCDEEEAVDIAQRGGLAAIRARRNLEALIKFSAEI
jgi:hypothetical protein